MAHPDQALNMLLMCSKLSTRSPVLLPTPLCPYLDIPHLLWQAYSPYDLAIANSALGVQTPNVLDLVSAPYYPPNDPTAAYGPSANYNNNPAIGEASLDIQVRYVVI